MAEHETSLAVLVDFENMARPGAKGRGDFDINLVLNRLAEKGRVIVKRAYADWSRYRDARRGGVRGVGRVPRGTPRAAERGVEPD